MNNYFEVLKRYTDFNGRSRRKEFWMFFLFHIIIIYGLVALMIATGSEIFIIILSLYVLGTILPSIAVQIRRMHDSGKSGWFILIPYYSFYLLCIDSQPENNQYGPNPKGIGNDEIGEIGKFQE